MTEQYLDAACHQARQRLLEGLPAPGHLRECGSCRAFEARLALVDRLLAAPEARPDPPAHLAAATLRRIAERQERRQRRRVAALAGAALVLSGVGVWSGFRLLSDATAAGSTFGAASAQLLRDALAAPPSWLATLAAALPPGLDGALPGWSLSLPGGSGLVLALATLAAVAGSWMVYASVSEG